MDIVQSASTTRPGNQLALIIGCTILGFAAGGILVIAILESDGFMALKAAFCNAPLIESIPRIEERDLRGSHSIRLVPVALLTIAIALFVVAMEEISWGQTLLGWETPESVASRNYQNETNLHNAFNFVLGRVYLAAEIIGFLAVSASILVRRKMPDNPLTAILPAAPMFWGVLWLPPASQSGVYSDNEPFESIVAILAIYYAIDISLRRSTVD